MLKLLELFDSEALASFLFGGVWRVGELAWLFLLAGRGEEGGCQLASICWQTG